MTMARRGGFRTTRSGGALVRGSGRTRLQDSPPVRTAGRLARTPPSPHTLKLLVAPVIFLVICSNVANVLWPTLQDEHPLLLIALSSINRYLILVSDDLDALSYYGVGTLRLLVSDPLFFLLGYWYGDRALAWMDQKAPTYGPMLRRFQDVFGKAAWPLVAIMPNNFICLFAGAAGMRISLFFALNLGGTLARLYLIRRLGETFASPIDSFQDLVAEYRWWFVAASAVLVAISLRGETKKGGDLDVLVHVDEELAEPAAADRVREQLPERDEE